MKNGFFFENYFDVFLRVLRHRNKFFDSLYYMYNKNTPEVAKTALNDVYFVCIH